MVFLFLGDLAVSLLMANEVSPGKAVNRARLLMYLRSGECALLPRSFSLGIPTTNDAEMRSGDHSMAMKTRQENISSYSAVASNARRTLSGLTGFST